MGERLKNKVAIVTGAGSSGEGWGNGKATSVLFAREGAAVLAVDNRPEAAEETAAIIADEGGECRVIAADVSQRADVERMVQECIARYGRVDVLHNNVGIVEGGGPVEASEESWDRVHDVNLKSVYLTCKAAIPQMVAQGGGAIVNVSSISGIRWMGIPYISYATTKAALNQLSRVVAVQYGKDNIRCNAILPGLMLTPIVESVLEAYPGGDRESYFAERNAAIPLGRFGDAWDVAQAALFLASDEAKYITGAELVVDGGVTLQTGI